MGPLNRQWHRRFRGAAVAAAAVLLVAIPAHRAEAEVSAVVDAQGRYLRTMVISHITPTRVAIWDVFLAQYGRVPLNPDGDRNRDLWPEIVEDPMNGNHPWVVWSRFNGRDYDLAWSRWIGETWGGVEWVQNAPTVGDDVDPHMTLDETGRPYLVWWSHEKGTGVVYFSIFLDTRWMYRYRVSDVDIDSRYARIAVNPDGSATIRYQSALGPESRTISFNDGVSINDDMDPVSGVTLSRR